MKAKYKKAGVNVLISEEIELKTKDFSIQKEEHFIIIKETMLSNI